jgi:hypothetical protein
MSGGKREIGDKIHGELFEWEGGGGLNGVEWGSDRVSANLVLLATAHPVTKLVTKVERPGHQKSRSTIALVRKRPR